MADDTVSIEPELVHIHHKKNGDYATVPASTAEVLKKSGWTVVKSLPEDKQ